MELQMRGMDFRCQHPGAGVPQMEVHGIETELPVQVADVQKVVWPVKMGLQCEGIQ